KYHLLAIDHLRQGIGLAGYAQKDPLVEFKREGYDLFVSMLDRIDIETLRLLFNLQVQIQEARAGGPASVEEALEQRLMMRRRRRKPAGVAMKSSFTAANASA